MDTWNLRENAAFKTKIAPDLYWVPANCLNHYETKNQSAKDEPHNLYELLTLFQQQDLEECYDDKILKADRKTSLLWECFDAPQVVAERYKRGHCAVFSLWLNYYLSKMYEDCGYIEIIRNKNMSWHVINYIFANGMFYIVDPSIYIKKYRNIIPVETGLFQSYAKAKLITGGVLQTSSLKTFANFYQRYVSLTDNSYVFIQLKTYDLPPFSIQQRGEGYSVYYPLNVDFEIINEYNRSFYSIEKTNCTI